jgi:hypothetical protein
MYASLADMRAAPASVPAAITDAQITAALSAAKERIDRYTGDTFEPVVQTVRALLANGLAPLPLRVQAVTQVSYADVAGGGSILPTTSYVVRSSATMGDIDAIQLLGYGVLSAAFLDIVYEPVRSNDFAADGERPVLVTGTFGWAAVPDAVHDAAVQLALADLPGGGTNAVVSAEGDASLGVAPTVPMMSRTPSSTGSVWADELLRAYVRKRLRVS